MVDYKDDADDDDADDGDAEDDDADDDDEHKWKWLMMTTTRTVLSIRIGSCDLIFFGVHMYFS